MIPRPALLPAPFWFFLATGIVTFGRRFFGSFESTGPIATCPCIWVQILKLQR